ncbi:MAG: hypothetical protein CMO80_02370 [Verrucomicrobiales bacterium]|nr:hypothetical protein [Verrucomicrobiales bacterium]|tara:strand:- start:511 stop:741 length:231 start_codon:yes stop_codon:yes gene_type:complete
MMPRVQSLQVFTVLTFAWLALAPTEVRAGLFGSRTDREYRKIRDAAAKLEKIGDEDKVAIRYRLARSACNWPRFTR